MKLEEISLKIKKERTLHGWSQIVLAELSSINVNTLKKMEAGFHDEVGIKKVEAVLDILELELSLRPKGRPKTLEEINNPEASLLAER